MRSFSLSFVAALPLAVAAAVEPAAAALGTIDTEARNAYIVDFDTNAVMLDKGADQRIAPASMAKIMTAYVVFDYLKKGRVSLEDTLLVSERAWAKHKTDESNMFMPLGAQVKVEDLLRGMIIQSGNDACLVLAEGLAGSEGAFVDELNETAHKLGLDSTHFANVDGMPDPEEYTTAHDLAVLARRIIVDFPEYYHYDSEKEFTYNNIRQGNRNPLLYKDLGADGLKTGHTEEAGYCLTASAIRNGRRVIMVLAGMPTMKSRDTESARLIDWAFREFSDFKIVKAGEPVDDAPVWLGTVATVPVASAVDVIVTLPRAARRDLKVSVAYDGPIKAPVAPGAAAGRLVVTAPNTDPITVPLVAQGTVERLGAFQRAAFAAGYLLFGRKN